MGQQQPVSKKHRRQVDDLIARIRLSADKLAADKPARGDLKILSRTLRELRYAFKVFAPYRNCRKVTVFGSARTGPEEATYQQAVAFGKAMAERDWMVVTGAAAGIMEAGHVGAGREHSMGLNIMLPFEQEANPVIAGDHKLVNMKYFFTVFHSMRYVHDQLVLRLETEVAPELLDDLNRYFKDLIVEGTLERSAALPEEKGEVDLKDLPRLVFHFNRRSHGRLRQLINCINQGTVPEKCRL